MGNFAATHGPAKFRTKLFLVQRVVTKYGQLATSGHIRMRVKRLLLIWLIIREIAVTLRHSILLRNTYGHK